MDETSESLLQAAHALLAEVGPDALTVRRIANEAGMSTMNVYSRFGGKDGVIDELFADGHRRLGAAITSIPETGDFVDDLIRTAHAYREFARSNPTYYGIMFMGTVNGFEPSPESVEMALGSLASFVERVANGQRQGVIVDQDGFGAVEIAAWLWATCHGLVSLELDEIAEERVSWAAIFEFGMRTALQGLHPDRAAAGPLPQAVGD